jgi:hypothetical protein
VQMARPQLVSLGPGTSLQIPYSFLPFALDFHVLLSRPGPLLTILDQTNSTLLQARLLEGLQVGVGTGLAGETPKSGKFLLPNFSKLIRTFHCSQSSRWALTPMAGTRWPSSCERSHWTWSWMGRPSSGFKATRPGGLEPQCRPFCSRHSAAIDRPPWT